MAVCNIRRMQYRLQVLTQSRQADAGLLHATLKLPTFSRGFLLNGIVGMALTCAFQARTASAPSYGTRVGAA